MLEKNQSSYLFQILFPVSVPEFHPSYCKDGRAANIDMWNTRIQTKMQTLQIQGELPSAVFALFFVGF